MAPIFILDAYNILRQFVKPVDVERDLEGARGTLEARLREFADTCPRGTRIVVVYDGKRGVVPRPRLEGGLEIVFSAPPRKADDVVLDLCRKLEGSAEVHAVTSDLRDIGNRIQGLRLRHWRSRDFADHVRRRTRRTRGEGGRAGPNDAEWDDGAEAKPGDVSPEEVKAWVERFGFGESGPVNPGGSGENSA